MDRTKLRTLQSVKHPHMSKKQLWDLRWKYPRESGRVSQRSVCRLRFTPAHHCK